MNTIVYLIRHSEPSKIINYLDSNDNLQVRNEKNVLSSFGEEKAKELSLNKEMQNIDVVISSKYVRAISTAKYIAENNSVNINIIEDFGERKFGISSWSELSSDFEVKQFEDENYKIGNGESQKEVRERMLKALYKILNDNKNKRIAIISHATAITYLLKEWCKIEMIDNKFKYGFKGKELLNNNFDYCEAFKLEFEDNNLINIENVSV